MLSKKSKREESRAGAFFQKFSRYAMFVIMSLLGLLILLHSIGVPLPIFELLNPRLITFPLR